VPGSHRVVDRYYDPATDQFLSVDPKVTATAQPYAFTSDDPLNGSDPLGLMLMGPNGQSCGTASGCSQLVANEDGDRIYGAAHEPNGGGTAPAMSDPGTHRDDDGDEVYTYKNGSSIWIRYYTGVVANTLPHKISASIWENHGLYKPETLTEWAAANQGAAVLAACEDGYGMSGCPTQTSILSKVVGMAMGDPVTDCVNGYLDDEPAKGALIGASSWVGLSRVAGESADGWLAPLTFLGSGLVLAAGCGGGN